MSNEASNVNEMSSLVVVSLFTVVVGAFTLTGEFCGRTDARAGTLAGWREDRLPDGRGWREDGQMDGRTDGRTDGWTDGRMGRRTDGRTYGRTDGRTDVRTDGRTDGRMGRRTDGRTNGRSLFNLICSCRFCLISLFQRVQRRIILTMRKAVVKCSNFKIKISITHTTPDGVQVKRTSTARWSTGSGKANFHRKMAYR